MRLAFVLLMAGSLSFVAAQGKGGGGGKGKGGGGIPNPVKLTVTGYTDGGMIPDNLKCADSPSPAISWTGAPAAAKSFAIIMHDTDVSFGGSDVLHWAIFDIPGTATSLPAGVEKKAEVAGGAKQLNNIGGTAGYMGPCPPAGHPAHHYIIEFYALSDALGLPATASRADLQNALNSKTVARGTYTGQAVPRP